MVSLSSQVSASEKKDKAYFQERIRQARAGISSLNESRSSAKDLAIQSSRKSFDRNLSPEDDFSAQNAHKDN